MNELLEAYNNYFSTKSNGYYLTEFEVDKYYVMESNRYYFVPELQRRVKFDGPVVIQLKSFFEGKPAFGYLVNCGQGVFQSDLVTDIDIEIPDNSIISEYTLQEGKFFYFDIASCFEKSKEDK